MADTAATAVEETASAPATEDTTAPAPGSDEHFAAALAAATKEVEGKADPAAVQEAETAEKAKEEDLSTKGQKDIEKDPEPEPEPAKVEDKPADKGTLGKARRLFSEGKVEEALELALGINLDKIEPTTKQWKGVKRIASEARAEAAAAKEEATRHIAEAKAALGQVMPFVEGAQAYLANDFAKFLRLTTGDTPETFQRKLIAQLHDAPAAQTDPAVLREIEQLKRERAEEKAAWKAEQTRMQDEQNRMRYQQAQNEWISDITAELKAAPQFAKVAAKPFFLQRVFAIQQQEYDPKTQQTMSTLEAAELVWEDLYGDVVETNPAAGAKAGTTQVPRANGTPTQHAGTGVAGTTSLRPVMNEAAPDSNLPWSPENQDKILEQWTRKAKSELLA